MASVSHTPLVGAPLSPREQQVLDLLCEGHSNKEIARTLGVSARTVEVHRMRAIARMGAKSSIHAVSMVFKQRFATLQVELTGMRERLDRFSSNQDAGSVR